MQISTHSLLFSDDFITEDEYSRMLYHEPRGISCAECHGYNGADEYTMYYSYRNRNGNLIRRKIDVRPIYKLELKDFVRSLNSNRKLRLMPRYRLSDFELTMIYQYLQKINNLLEDKNEKKIEESSQLEQIAKEENLQQNEVGNSIEIGSEMEIF
jgi:hypothetical protein